MSYLWNEVFKKRCVDEENQKCISADHWSISTADATTEGSYPITAASVAHTTRTIVTVKAMQWTKISGPVYFSTSIYNDGDWRNFLWEEVFKKISQNLDHVSTKPHRIIWLFRSWQPLFVWGNKKKPSSSRSTIQSIWKMILSWPVRTKLEYFGRSDVYCSLRPENNRDLCTGGDTTGMYP